MRAINRVFIFLIVILAIGSAILGFFIYQNRNLMRDRADSLAKNLVQMVRYLDRDSQTGVDREVTFTERNLETGEPDAGTLSWSRYLEEAKEAPEGTTPNTLRNALAKAADLADKINSQRNHLATTLAETAIFMSHPDNGLASILKHADPGQYQATSQTILQLAEAVNEKTSDMVDALTEIGRIVEVTVRKDEFYQRQQTRDPEGNLVQAGFEHQPLLRRIQDGVNKVASARTNYRDTVLAILTTVNQHDWSVTASQVRDPDNYARALATMTNDFTDLNAELIRSAQRAEQLARLEEELEATRGRLQTVIGERDRLNRRLTELEEQIEISEQVESRVDAFETDDPQAAFPRDSKGQVIEVNDQFGFVIIDLGSRDRVARGLQLLVDRDGKFIARIEVTTVRTGHAVAEVVPRVMVDQIRAGDQVISP